MTDLNETTKNKPSVYIHAKVPNGKGTRVGSQIGVGWFFETDDGVGVNIVLDAQPIPLNGQIELVGFPAKS